MTMQLDGKKRPGAGSLILADDHSGTALKVRELSSTNLASQRSVLCGWTGTIKRLVQSYESLPVQLWIPTSFFRDLERRVIYY